MNLSAADFRAHRELVIRARAHLTELRALLPGRELPFNRHLLGNRHHHRADGCRWCGAPTEGRRQWHDECVRVYTAASGRTIMADGRPLARYAACELCGGPGDEIDHRTALAVAWARDPDRAWRAWSPLNLRRLCTRCHKAKSAADAQRLADARRHQQTFLAA